MGKGIGLGGNHDTSFHSPRNLRIQMGSLQAVQGDYGRVE